jgi:hypothetical protein
MVAPSRRFRLTDPIAYIWPSTPFVYLNYSGLELLDVDTITKTITINFYGSSLKTFLN